MLELTKGWRWRELRAAFAAGAPVHARDSVKTAQLLIAAGRKRASPAALRPLITRGARLDIPDGDGQSAAAILLREREPAYRRLATSGS